MGFYFNKGWSPSDTTAHTLHDWIKQEYPDMPTKEIMLHILNLCQVMDMTQQDLTKWLLEDWSAEEQQDSETDWWL